MKIYQIDKKVSFPGTPMFPIPSESGIMYETTIHN